MIPGFTSKYHGSVLPSLTGGLILNLETPIPGLNDDDIVSTWPDGSPFADNFTEMLANKQDAGTATLKFLLRQGGTDYEPGSNISPPLGSNQYFKESFLEDPDTSAPWTAAGVNSLEFGYERTA